MTGGLPGGGGRTWSHTRCPGARTGQAAGDPVARRPHQAQPGLPGHLLPSREPMSYRGTPAGCSERGDPASPAKNKAKAWWPALPGKGPRPGTHRASAPRLPHRPRPHCTWPDLTPQLLAQASPRTGWLGSLAAAWHGFTLSASVRMTHRILTPHAHQGTQGGAAPGDPAPAHPAAHTLLSWDGVCTPAGQGQTLAPQPTATLATPCRSWASTRQGGPAVEGVRRPLREGRRLSPSSVPKLGGDPVFL